MRITELMPVRNEEWCLGFSLRAVLLWADDAIVLNHASTDGTREILEEIQGEVGRDRLIVLDHPDPVWRDTTQRQLLLEAGRRAGGEFFALFDADEVLTGNLLPSVRGIVETLKPGECLTLPWIPMWKGIDRYRPGHSVQGATSAFRDAPLLHWRAEKGYDQHRRHPYESTIVPQPKVSGGGMHFQFADWRRITAKHALYKMNELARWPGRLSAQAINRQYDATLDQSKVVTQAVPQEWFEPYQGIVSRLRLDVEPWQEAECQRLWSKFGPQTFAGLDLYGIVGNREELIAMAPRTPGPSPATRPVVRPAPEPKPAPKPMPRVAPRRVSVAPPRALDLRLNWS